jgi:biopolymer transport protein ExbB/TolQ
MRQVKEPSPARTFFRALFTAVEPRMVAGCSLYHGFGDLPGAYCVVVESEDAALIGSLARMATAANWGLQIPPRVVVEQGPLRAERLQLAARVNAQGLLDEVQFDAISEFWRPQAQQYAPYPEPPRPPEPPRGYYPREAPPEPPLHAAPPPPPPPAPPPLPPQAPPSYGMYGRPAAPTEPLPSAGYEPPPRGPAPASASLSRHPSFPRSIPGVLETPEGRDRTLAAVGGAALGLLASFAIFGLAQKSTMLFQMFDFRKPPTIIPVSVLMMFFWGCGICLLRWRRLSAMESISDRALLREAIPILETLGLHALRADLEEPVVAHSPLLRRMRAAVHQWSLHPGLQDTDVVLQQLAESDDESIHTGYSLARTFVWALPVLGLIGTVIGISTAVGGFAQFLGGSIDDVNIIKQNLVNVTGGLSFAFLITLEGLLTSLIVMLAASSLQTRERELYAGVQEDVADQLVPALQRVAPESFKTQSKQAPDWGGLREALAEHASANAGQFNNAIDRMLTGLGERQRELVAEFKKAGESVVAKSRDAEQGQLTTALAGWMTALTEKHGEWVASLKNIGDDLKTRARDADDSLWRNAQERARVVASELSAALQRAGAEVAAGSSRHNQDFLVKLEAAFQKFSTDQASFASESARRQQDADRAYSSNMAQQQVLIQKFSEQAEIIRGAVSAVSALGDTTQRILQCQQDLRQALSQLDAAPARAAFDGFSQALQASSGEMSRVMQAAEHLASLTSQIISAQTSLQQATRQLADSQLTATLNEFGKSLAGLAPVLASFQRPFVLQAVPFARENSAGQ